MVRIVAIAVFLVFLVLGFSINPLVIVADSAVLCYILYRSNLKCSRVPDKSFLMFMMTATSNTEIGNPPAEVTMQGPKLEIKGG